MRAGGFQGDDEMDRQAQHRPAHGAYGVQTTRAAASDRPQMRHPDRWLAALRIVVGLWFLKAILTKLTVTLAWGVLPVPVASDRWIAVMPKLIAQYAAEHPIPAYRAFLLDVVAPNEVFAHLTALGEVAVGLSLTLGLLTEVGAFFGLLQVVFYGLAVQHTSPGQQGFHVLLATSMLAFLFARAGRVWGVDAWRSRRGTVAAWLARARSAPGAAVVSRGDA
jgi:uncharacterized membrane protein YphA (DoxX/SURF4 family)